MISKDQIKSIMKDVTTDNLEKYTNPINDTFEKYEINTSLRMAAFLSQIAHESNQLSDVSENLNYSVNGLLKVFPKYFRTVEEAQLFARQPEKIANKVYANRMGNGDEASGDGWRFRGRGAIQITGHDNYVLCGRELGFDLMKQPEMLEKPIGAILSAGWFWNMRGLNAFADRQEFETITKRINGGLNGLEERLMYYEIAKQIL